MSPNKPKKARGCRICLSAKRENRVCFEVNSKWSRLFQYCFDITINDNDNGPRVLCGECSTKMKEFSDLKTAALKSESLWNDVWSAKVKVDPVSIEIETIEVKDENSSDHETSFTDWQVTDIYGAQIDIKEQNQDDYSINESKVDCKTEIEVVKEEVTLEPDKPCKQKPAVPESLTEEKFIKKYFEVLKLTTGKWKTKYKCAHCGDEFKRRDALPVHVRKCQKSQVEIVKDELKAGKALREEPKLFYCGLCDFSSADENAVLTHFNEHCTNNDLNCKSCDYIGRDTADIVSHRYKHLPPNYNYKIECPACNKIRKNPLTLQFHYRSVHLKKSGGWCSVCNKIFNDYKYFRNHERLHKTDSFTCDFCGMKFLFRNAIEMHMKELHMNIRDFICDTCGMAFKRNNALTYHIRAHHTINKPVPCNHCGKKFKNDYSLKMHMKMVKREKNYICDVCSKRFPVLNLLQKHMFRHTGQKPFACETCGMSYKSKQYLQIHMRKHTGDFPYKCDSCEKQFISSTQLRNHTGVHTGIHRVKCLVCEKTFRERKQMLAHCQTKHDSVIVKLENQGNSLIISA